MILAFLIMASMPVLLFLSPVFETCQIFAFPPSNCLFRTAENKWSAMRCSLWKGEV
jgi:hypothetical protein